jgi:hypothetical protein
MPISDLGSHVITGKEFLAHWSDVNADRTARTTVPFTLPGGYAEADLTAEVAAVEAAITAQEDLQNGLTIAMAARDAARGGLRNRIMEFRKAVEYRLKGSGYERSLPDTPHPDASEQKVLRALDDMASLWTRVNAASGLPNFTPPLLLLGGYALAAFRTDVTAMRAKFLAVTEAENGARIGRKTRDLLLGPLRDRLVQYRQGIEVEYGAEHVFTQTLPDVYDSGGSSPAGGGGGEVGGDEGAGGGEGAGQTSGEEGGGVPVVPAPPTLPNTSDGQVSAAQPEVSGATNDSE